jgi:DNA-directed RNA polymerase subunit alpha
MAIAPTAPSGLKARLAQPIDDLGLSVRSLNSLKNSSIRTLQDLVEFNGDDLLKVKNVGDKALQEIAELLQREGLNFGMEFEEVEGDLRIVNEGTAPMAGASAEEEG